MIIDINDERAEGQTLDLGDTQFISQTRVRKGTMADAGQSDIVVITAGAKQRPNESRSQLLERNAGIMRSVMNGMKPIRDDAIILVVSNPCDVLTHVAWKASGLPSRQVFGSGTFLDSMRLRSYLSKEIGVNENNVHVYVLGEHGDTQFVAWSSAQVGCSRIVDGGFEDWAKDEYRQKAEHDTMRKAYDIIKLKGATYYGIASCVSSLCQSVLFDEKYVRPVSVYDDEKKVVLSWPAVIGRHGIEKIMPVKLSPEENDRLQNAISVLKTGLHSIS